MLQGRELPTSSAGSEDMSEKTTLAFKLDAGSEKRYETSRQVLGLKCVNPSRSWRTLDSDRPNKQKEEEGSLNTRLLENGSQALGQINGVRTMPKSRAHGWEPMAGGSKLRQSGSTVDRTGHTTKAPVGTADPASGSKNPPVQEWRTARVQHVFLSGRDEPRKANLCRSASLSEKELKEAKTRSQEIAAHLTTPPGTNSRGVLLFNKRRQRVNNLTSLSNKGGSSGAITRGEQGGTLQDIPSQHGRAAYVNPQPQSKAEPEEPVSLNHFGKPLENTMEEDETKPASEPFIGKMTDTQEEEGHGDEVPLQETPAPSTEEPSALEVEQAPLGDTLKESLIPTPTNGAVDSYTKEIESAPAEQTEPRETPNKQYCEVHLTLSKPAPVANRTARPFGNRSPVKIAVAEVRSPTIDLPPPPTYAETQSSPTPVPHVRSPPSYSALYPTVPETRPPISLQGSGATEMRHQPMPKSGVLEDIMARRGNKKSMFTFIEKPKLAPNPDLLSLVQNADEKRKQKDHGEVLPEEELFALGAEASNFLNDSRLRGGSHIAPADIPPEWATCLKSPDLLHKPPLTPHQSLPHAGGKGAELFARRQSRMEKYVIESPTHPDMLRSPSPTMSLPPSWKYATSAHVSPTSRPFNHPAKSLQSTPKPSSNSQITNDNAETEQSQKELQISKRQPYQLQSSLFILSPVKDPVSSLPRAAPPPKPMLHDTTRYARQTSCPTSPLPPPSHVQTSGPFRSIQRATSPGGDVRSAAENTRMSFTNVPVATVVPPTSPVSFMHTRGPSPHARVNVQSPRPSFSTKAAGIESQVWKPSYYYK